MKFSYWHGFSSVSWKHLIVHRFKSGTVCPSIEDVSLSTARDAGKGSCISMTLHRFSVMALRTMLLHNCKNCHKSYELLLQYFLKLDSTDHSLSFYMIWLCLEKSNSDNLLLCSIKGNSNRLWMIWVVNDNNIFILNYSSNTVVLNKWVPIQKCVTELVWVWTAREQIIQCNQKFFFFIFFFLALIINVNSINYCIY